jgi:hypothetical protein
MHCAFPYRPSRPKPFTLPIRVYATSSKYYYPLAAFNEIGNDIAWLSSVITKPSTSAESIENCTISSAGKLPPFATILLVILPFIYFSVEYLCLGALPTLSGQPGVLFHLSQSPFLDGVGRSLIWCTWEEFLGYTAFFTVIASQLEREVRWSALLWTYLVADIVGLVASFFGHPVFPMAGVHPGVLGLLGFYIHSHWQDRSVGLAFAFVLFFARYDHIDGIAPTIAVATGFASGIFASILYGSSTGQDKSD